MRCHMSLVDDVINHFKSRKAGLRCADLVSGLESLGYVVTPKQVQHHKVYGHPHVTPYSGGNFNCGHGKNPQILTCYVRNIIAELTRAQTSLEEYICKNP